MPYCHIGWLLDSWLKATEVIMFRRPCLLSLLFPSLYVTVLYDRVYADSERKREKPGPALWLSCNWSIAGSTVVQRGSVWWAWEYLTALKKRTKKKKKDMKYRTSPTQSWAAAAAWTCFLSIHVAWVHGVAPQRALLWFGHYSPLEYTVHYIGQFNHRESSVQMFPKCPSNSTKH